MMLAPRRAASAMPRRAAAMLAALSGDIAIWTRPMVRDSELMGAKLVESRHVAKSPGKNLSELGQRLPHGRGWRGERAGGVGAQREVALVGEFGVVKLARERRESRLLA